MSASTRTPWLISQRSACEAYTRMPTNQSETRNTTIANSHHVRTRGSTQLRRRAFAVMARGAEGGGGRLLASSSFIEQRARHDSPQPTKLIDPQKGSCT